MVEEGEMSNVKGENLQFLQRRHLCSVISKETELESLFEGH